MRPSRHPLAALLAAALLLGACGPESTPSAVTETGTLEAEAQRRADAEARRTPLALDAAFDEAARDFGVPAELLKAIAYVETRWEMVRGESEFEGQAPAFGVMALRGERLTEGARLAGVSAEAARTEPRANIRAAAALLAAWSREVAAFDRADLGAWAPLAARYGGIADGNAQALYVHQDVYGIVRQGAIARTPEGGVAVSLLPRSDVQPQFREPDRTALASGPDYAASIWRPSPNYNARPTGSIGDPAYIIIHTCEGSYSSCWSWLTNSSSGVSAHYVVSESGSEVSQLVREADRAWHVGASYDCNLNSGVDCWRNGYSVNHFSVGIEHGGYASQSSFPTGQIDASARLACDISRDQAVPRDRYHVVAHAQLQPANRTDPGPNWPWSEYLSKINGYCGSGSTGLVIDSNNNNNDTSKGYIEVSGNWTSSTNVAGYYGSGYWVAPTQAVSDPATFYFYMSAAGTRTIDAWWTAASDRAPSAPWIMWNSAGTKLATVYTDQRYNGGKWVTLGTWSFSAGWNKVQLSRWTTAGYYVVADAIRVR